MVSVPAGTQIDDGRFGFHFSIVLGTISFFGSQVLVGISTAFEDRLHLGLGDYREGTRIEQEEDKEEPNGPDKDPYIHKGGREHGPGRWQVITVKRGHDDHETLEPHPYVHHDGDKEGEHDAGT